MKILNKQKGFAIFGVLFILLLAVALVGGAYYIAKHYNKTSSSTTTKPTDSYAGWQTYTGKVTSDSQNPAHQADQVAYTLKYPADWKYYPIDSYYSYQRIVPANGTISQAGISFNSVATSLDAEHYFNSFDKTGLVGPTWQGVKGFTTRNGYSAYTAKLDAATGTTYETYITINGGVVDFNYGASQSKYFDTFQQIFDAVKSL